MLYFIGFLQKEIIKADIHIGTFHESPAAPHPREMIDLEVPYSIRMFIYTDIIRLFIGKMNLYLCIYVLPYQFLFKSNSNSSIWGKTLISVSKTKIYEFS